MECEHLACNRRTLRAAAAGAAAQKKTYRSSEQRTRSQHITQVQQRCSVSSENACCCGRSQRPAGPRAGNLWRQIHLNAGSSAATATGPGSHPATGPPIVIVCGVDCGRISDGFPQNLCCSKADMFAATTTGHGSQPATGPSIVIVCDIGSG